MNTTILLALFEDARQQVLDNKVFRLLIILTAIPILGTFVIGFREEHVSFLWGMYTVEYEDLLGVFGGPGAFNTEEIHVLLIQIVQELMVSFFAGSLGMMLCIAATAFFAPRILEKGAADTIFSKPVSRGTILLSRYFAGILFVAFIGSVLVTGMYLGFLTTSGYGDVGFLWGALTLVYLYAMMHAFSIAIAVFTRSSTAAILLTLFLFMFCGGIHGTWLTVEHLKEQNLVAQLRSAGEEDEEEEGDEEEEESGVVDTLVLLLNTTHYVLPKTSDADMITRKLRRAIMESPPAIETKDGDFLLKGGPEDFELVAGSQDEFEAGGVRWTSLAEDGTERGRVSVRRYERPMIERTIGSRTRTRPQTSKDAADALEEELEGSVEELETENEQLNGVRVLRVSWKEGVWNHDTLFFTFDTYMYEVHTELLDGFLEGWPEQAWRRKFLDNGNVVLGQVAGMDAGMWYEKVFTWDAEWKYNIFFSIGSSLAFIVAMLSLAWLRLRTIDF